jgi:16S rRNA (cytosine1402-N4)-methyltransferase
MSYHKPVLLEESVEGLTIRPEGVYADLTFGGGGHSLRILEKLGKKGRLFGFDQDPDALANALNDKRFTPVHANFRFLRNFLRYYKVQALDGIIADLGISSHQVDAAKRGFSYLGSAGMDMRMNPSSELTAQKIINEYSGEDLIRIFKGYGELSNAAYLSKLILKGRASGKYESSESFIEAIGAFLPERFRNKLLSQIYQALRIEVNDELGALRDMLSQTPEVLTNRGRIVVLSYHSLEDRLVKNFFKSGNLDGTLEKDFYGNVKSVFRIINKNVIVPSDAEIQGNPRARSAKLRIAEKI